jgi:hypothetical protein
MSRIYGLAYGGDSLISRRYASSGVADKERRLREEAHAACRSLDHAIECGLLGSNPEEVKRREAAAWAAIEREEEFLAAGRKRIEAINARYS